MSSRPRIFAVSGQGFDGGVVLPGPPATAPATATAKPIDDRLTTACEGLGALAGEERARVSAWILGRMKSNEEGDEILCNMADVTRAGLITEHEAKKQECRAARTEKANLVSRVGELTRELQKQRERTFFAAGRLDQAKANLAGLDRFASREERHAAEQEVAKAETEWVSERDSEAPFVELINFLNLTEKERVTKKINELEAQELRLACLISGEPFVDATYGIQVPGRD